MTQHDDALHTAGLAAPENWRAAAACRSHGEFIERLEYDGRRLAKWDVGPDFG